MGDGGEAGTRGSGEVVILSEAKEQSLNVAPCPGFPATLRSAWEGLRKRGILDWRFWVDNEPRPGWANMAIDLALLDRAEQHGESWLRLYQWQPHCLSFGRHEPASRRYDVERIRDLGLDTVRRPTGGRAVWHGPELTYAIAAPSGILGSLRAAYLEVHAMLAQALGTLGVATSLAPRAHATPVDAGACFSQPAGGEVMVAGRKVVGSAQLRQGKALLQHGSILLHDDQRIVRSVSLGGASVSFPEPSTPIPLGRHITAGEVAGAVGRAACDRWHGEWRRVARPDDVLEAASRYFPQFRSPAWTWAR